MTTSLIPCRPAPTRAEMDAAFADFLRVDVANGDASPDTIAGYRGVVEIWVNWCFDQGFDPATVTVMHIKRYRQTLIERNLSPVTVRWNLMVIRRFYEAARNAGLRPDNPAAGVKSPRIRHAAEDFKYLSEDELAKLLAAVPDPDVATGKDKIRRLRDLLTIGLMALQGLRTIEVARASVEDLTEKGEHLVLLVRGKTKDRIAYLRPDVAAHVRQYLAIRGKVEPDELGTPLFTNAAHHPHRLGRSLIRFRTSQCLRMAGLKRQGVSDHALRHTAATLGYLHTGDLRAVQDFLGHADPRMTARYAHVVDMAKRNPALFIPVKVG
jgi:site-specific recombinase XerD